MVRCEICKYDSSNTKYHEQKRSLHKIPDDPERRKQFILLINTLNGKSKKIRKGTKTIIIDGQEFQDPSRENARICSSHFKSEWLMLKTSCNGRVTTELHKDAYPIYINQQEKDEEEKLLNKPASIQQAELPITPRATNKSEVALSEKMVVIPQSDGTISIRTSRNKMVKLTLSNTFEVPSYDATKFALHDPAKYQGTSTATGTTSTFEVPYYDAKNLTFHDPKYQGTSSATGTTKVFEVPKYHGTTSFTQSTSKVPKHHGTTSFTEDNGTSQAPKCQDTTDVCSGKSAFLPEPTYYTVSFVESDGTAKTWTNEIYMNNWDNPQYKGTAMGNNITPETLDSPGDEVEFMKSTHTQVPATIQPVEELPVIEQQILDAVLQLQEEINLTHEEDIDVMVDNLLREATENMQNSNSRDSLEHSRFISSIVDPQ